MESKVRWQTIIYWLIIIVLGFTVLYQCHNTNKPAGVGEYVYIDISRTLHTKHDCPAVYRNNSQTVTRKKKDELVRSHLDKICSRCVTDSQYDILRAMVLVNEGNGVFYEDEDNN